MREVNFSIPNVNKAAVGITAALYDRRALDSTSTLPLINSLNHLAYLTTSSARIRDILTVDGGIERLICILKEGRSKEMMETWKWNLAFQCVVNIGVRGSEQVRTRVVEADVVPIIATLLENHALAAEKAREEVEAERKKTQRSQGGRISTGSPSSSRAHDSEHRSNRRQPPPSIQIPLYDQLVAPQDVTQNNLAAENTPTTTLPQLALTSPQDPPQPRADEPRHLGIPDSVYRRPLYPPARAPRQNNPNEVRGGGGGFLSSLEAADGFGLRTVRDADRLPSHLPALQNGIMSQPESPTTPGVPLHLSLNAAIRNQRRPSISHQNSGSGDSDDGGNEVTVRDDALPTEEPMVDIQASVELDGTDGPAAILGAIQAELDISNGTMAEGQEDDVMNLARRPGSDGSIIPTNIQPAANDAQVRLSPVPGATEANRPQFTTPTRLVIASAPNPRDEDVLMSLQLLAYVSKYCYLRTYFQNTHLVPRLRSGVPEDEMDTDEMEEYILPDDYNIFPLVEKFTVRHNSQDMQYWAGVVMRNLCRKDDSQGGIRQCAYYNCGKWEEWPRQFAKCRRCRRTKYCSKECQKNAWVFHRHWCQQASP